MEIIVRLFEVQVVEDLLAEFVGVVLTSVDKSVRDALLNARSDDGGELDKLRAGAKDESDTWKGHIILVKLLVLHMPETSFF